MMIRMEPIDEKSPHLQAVKRLWRANSDWLGFYPEGAFLDRARRREILVALDGQICSGYLLYYKTERRKVRLTHLCVEESHRSQGLARRLVDSLRNLTRDYLGIGLYCRRDFSTWSAWPKLGFVALAEKRGRGEDGGELTYFWMSNLRASLLGAPRPHEDERVDVVLDANVFFDLDDPGRNGAEESQGIVADWLRPLIRPCITDEVFNEIQRQEDRTRRSERLRAAKRFDSLECATEDFQSAEAQIRALVGDPRNARDEADIRQVARAVASKAAIFVTRDEALLGHAGVVYSKYGLSLVRPAELVGRFEELRNEPAYQHERLAGTSIDKSRMSRPSECLISAFQDSTGVEKKWQLEQRLNAYLSAPDKYNCFLVADASSSPERRSPLALYVVERASEHVINVPLFRLAASVRTTRAANTLFRTLLAGIVEHACRSQTKAVMFGETLTDPAWMEPLRDSGFFPVGPAWAKLSLRMAAPPDRISLAIRSALADAGLECKELAEVADLLADDSIRGDPLAAWEAEHLLWPAKLLDCGIPSYIVPIRPGWASDLFDSGLADGRLWGADADLALNPESVYYRSARNGPSRPFGRILWYVSQVKRDPETMRIRACSRLADVVVGSAKDLYREFRRLGVYGWGDVLKTADGDPEGRIMAMRFDDNELFPKPLKWDDFQGILDRHGKRTNIQSPVEIPEPALVDLYRRGLGIE